MSLVESNSSINPGVKQPEIPNNFVDLQNIEQEKFHDECAVGLVWDRRGRAAQFARTIAIELQHRGPATTGLNAVHFQEDGNVVLTALKKAEGKAEEVLADESEFMAFSNAAVIHDRYATHDGNGLQRINPLINAQPSYIGETQLEVGAKLRGDFSFFALNGNVVNTKEFSQKLTKDLPDSSEIGNNDSALMHRLDYELDEEDLVERAKLEAEQWQGAFNVVKMSKDGLTATRDGLGVHPLWLGWSEDGDTVAVSSETAAFDKLGLKYRSFNPGEVVHVDKNGQIRTDQYVTSLETALCVFEYVYLSRGDSMGEFGELIDVSRYRTGEYLARKEKLDIYNNKDKYVLMGVPFSGLQGAKAYADIMGIELTPALMIRPDPEKPDPQSRKRPFLEPEHLREEAANEKFILNQDFISLIVGKEAVVVDDSIVRGINLRPVIELLRDAGATKVHIRSASSQIEYSCHLGVNTPTQGELISFRNGGVLQAIAQEIGADSVRYLSLRELIKAVLGEELFNKVLKKNSNPNRGLGMLCMACMSGEYPIPNYDEMPQKELAAAYA